MELGNQIKAHRAALSLSQEELAEKVYVTRQTVSNWETGKSYPDIHSLLLLSALFDVSLDQLIKGDLETMKQEVNAADVKAMNRDAIIFPSCSPPRSSCPCRCSSGSTSTVSFPSF